MNRIALFIVLLVTKICHCQSISGFELYAGPSIVSQNGYGTIHGSPQPKTGFCISANLNHKLLRKLELTANVRYEKKGSKWSNTFVTGTYSGYNQPTNSPPFVETTALTVLDDYYLSFGLMPRIAVGKKNHFKIGAGFYYGVLKRSIFDYKIIQNDKIEFSQRISPDRYVKNNDYGLDLSVRYTTPFRKRTALSFQLLNSIGLMNITTIYPTKINNVTLSLLFGISLR